jgi:hypothetical protein
VAIQSTPLAQAPVQFLECSSQIIALADPRHASIPHLRDKEVTLPVRGRLHVWIASMSVLAKNIPDRKTAITFLVIDH